MDSSGMNASWVVVRGRQPALIRSFRELGEEYKRSSDVMERRYGQGLLTIALAAPGEYAYLEEVGLAFEASRDPLERAYGRGIGAAFERPTPPPPAKRRMVATIRDWLVGLVRS